MLIDEGLDGDPLEEERKRGGEDRGSIGECTPLSLELRHGDCVECRLVWDMEKKGEVVERGERKRQAQELGFSGILQGSARGESGGEIGSDWCS